MEATQIVHMIVSGVSSIATIGIGAYFKNKREEDKKDYDKLVTHVAVLTERISNEKDLLEKLETVLEKIREHQK